MKIFRYSNGGRAGETMTVVELCKKLAEYPGDMPVFGTWETVNGYITPDNFTTEIMDKGNELDKCECLLIDVERH